jgi:tRNA (mo5U34)-methyltransferase
MIGSLSPSQIREKVEALGPWFHNLDLNGVPTAPGHFLGDYPAVKWRRFADAVPQDLTGKTVLDIGWVLHALSGSIRTRNISPRPASRRT